MSAGAAVQQEIGKPNDHLRVRSFQVLETGIQTAIGLGSRLAHT
jgi:hypothetical protein